MEEDRQFIKSHNKSLLLYHFVCPGKHRRDAFSNQVEETLKFLCEEIGKRYEIYTIEIVSDERTYLLIN